MENTENSIEHICQNCGSDISGRYCSYCGQKKASLHDRSIKSLLEHFFEELFTWDSRFFRSIKYLFTRPGFLTHEYVSSRYQSYISPVKMFLFTSFVLFLIMIKSDPDQYKALVTESDADDFMREFILEQQSKSTDSQELFIENYNDQFNDNITLYIFVIMFLFSVLLKIVYLPKHYYYAEHIVFTLHFFTFVLWCFLAGVAFQDLGDFSIFFFMFFVPAVYLLFAIKRVYHRTLWKAVLVTIFMTFSYWILVTIWMIGTVLVSAIRAA
ncbi:MAG: DUF3667 domain-containing protein [Ignavibacteria bacterium]|nr:DUF3667 domain-containing protein [Ignavibacteria bacterium]